MARFLYFSWVREKIGTHSEQLTLPPEVTTVGGVIDFLRARGEGYVAALTHPQLRVAVNQTYARWQDPVAEGDEIAIFPPVSGG